MTRFFFLYSISMLYDLMSLDVKSSLSLSLAWEVTTYHSKANIGHFQCRAIIGAITSHCHYFSVSTHFALNDSLHQRVLVSGGGACQYTQIHPNFVHQVLLDLRESITHSSLSFSGMKIINFWYIKNTLALSYINISPHHPNHEQDNLLFL